MIIRRKLIPAVVMALVAILFTACANSKHVAYFQNSSTVDLEKTRFLYDARIMPKDILSITVNTTDAEASLPFNLVVRTTLNASSSGSISGGGQGSLQSYLVDNDGCIEFPRIGKLKLVGLTKSEAEELIKEKIMPYLSGDDNPIVTVRMMNYKFAVLGEVNSQGLYTATNEKISILEALAQAGDLTIYGKRENVMLIREDETGKKSIHTLNLNDANLLSSPYYYIQQNDVIYVEPLKVKAQSANISSATTFWFSATSMLLSVTSMLYSLLR